MTATVPPSGNPPIWEEDVLRESIISLRTHDDSGQPSADAEAHKEEIQLNGQAAKEAKKEEASGVHRLGVFYGQRADELERKGRKWFWIGTGLVSCIIMFYLAYSWWYVHEMTILKSLVGGNTPLSEKTVFISYYTGKVLGLILLTSALVWCAAIYNHVRRLKITYRDKEVTANSYYSFMMHDSASHDDVRKHALENLFTSTLQQMEETTKHRSSSNIDLATLKTITEALTPLIKVIRKQE